MRSLSDAVGRVTAKTCSRKFVALGRVLRHWGDIVGADLAAKTQPVRLTYRRTGDKKPTATLYIATSPAQATALHYQSGVILERINQVFGERWIERLQFVIHQGAGRPKPEREPPSAEACAAAAQVVEGMKDEELRQALAALGQEVLNTKGQAL